MTTIPSGAGETVRLHRARLAVLDHIDELSLATAMSRRARGQDIGRELGFLAENYERRIHLVQPAKT